MSNVQTLQFYTLGSDFTKLVRDLIAEGAFYNAHEILKDGGLPDQVIREFSVGGWKFIGDSRDEGGLSVIKDTEMTDEEFLEFITAAIKTMIFTEDDLTLIDVFSYNIEKKLEDKNITKHINSMFKFFNKDFLLSKLTPRILKEYGYEFSESLGSYANGVILRDGRIVLCGYMEHMQMYPILYDLKLVDSPDWTDSSDNIHISSGQMSGGVSRFIQYPEIYQEDSINLTPIIKTIINNKDNLSFYGSSTRGITENLLRFFEGSEDHGGKFGKLTFVKNVYPEVKLPKFSKEPILGVKNCIRTSPKLSIPGLLNSKFNIDKNSIKEIEEDWEKVKDVVNNNKLFWFYQEFLEGPNGVAHCRGNGYEVTYSCSIDRGSIVDGKEGNYNLNKSLFTKLSDIIVKISKDLDRDIQIEFVIKDDEIYVVQLRTLEKTNTYRPYQIDHKKVVLSGRSFSMGYSDLISKEDVLVVNSECNREDIIGKKALLVREESDFSHALALSFALRIPSMYGVGYDFELPDKLIMDTKGRDGYVLID